MRFVRGKYDAHAPSTLQASFLKKQLTVGDEVRSGDHLVRKVYFVIDFACSLLRSIFGTPLDKSGSTLWDQSITEMLVWQLSCGFVCNFDCR